MLCELCHKKEARQAILHKTDDGERELYVCPACAAKHPDEGVTRDAPAEGGNGVQEEEEKSMELIKVATDVAASIAGAFKAIGDKINASKTCAIYNMAREKPEFEFCGAVHLKALDMLGEIRHVISAMNAVGLIPVSLELDGTRCLGSAFKIGYKEGDEDLARRWVKELIAQEGFARLRLVQEHPLLIEDAAARTVALLQNCRLISRAELVDAYSMLKFVRLYLKITWLPNAYIDTCIKELSETISRQRDNTDDGEPWTDERSELAATVVRRKLRKVDISKIKYKN